MDLLYGAVGFGVRRTEEEEAAAMQRWATEVILVRVPNVNPNPTLINLNLTLTLILKFKVLLTLTLTLIHK